MKTLNELFNSKNKFWKSRTQSSGNGLEHVLATLVNDKFLLIFITEGVQKYGTKKYNNIEIDFGTYQDPRLKVFDNVNDLANSDIERYSRQVSINITGGGDVAKIFSVIMNKVEEYVKKEKPHFIKYGSKVEGGRNSLYNKLAVLADRKLKNYTYAIRREAWEDWDDGNDEMIKIWKFSLIRNDTMKELGMQVRGYETDGSPKMKRKKKR